MRIPLAQAPVFLSSAEAFSQSKLLWVEEQARTDKRSVDSEAVAMSQEFQREDCDLAWKGLGKGKLPASKVTSLS